MIFDSAIFQYLYDFNLLSLNTLKLGLQGLPNGDKLSVNCIQNYVNSILNEPIINEEYTNTLVEILIADTANDIVDQISKISDSDRHDKEIIAAVELAIVLDSCINRDIIYSLIDIAKFWDIWAGWANVKLSYYQGTNDELDPNDYYSKENFDLIYQKSREWSNKILNS